MRAEYDFSSAARGKHHEVYRARTNVVFLEPDLIEAFPDSAAVNKALRRLLKLSRSSRPKKALDTTGRLRKAKSKKRARMARS